MTRLYEAAKAGNFARVEEYLLARDNVHELTDGETPLHAVLTGIVTEGLFGEPATLDDRLSIARKLISSGVDIEAKSADIQFTALHWAAELQLPEFIELLLEKGAQVDPKTNSGDTPLACLTMLRVQCPFEHTKAAMKLLLDAGADIHARDSIGFRPLTHAASTSPELLDLMMKYQPKDQAQPAYSANEQGLAKLLQTFSCLFPKTGHGAPVQAQPAEKSISRTVS